MTSLGSIIVVWNRVVADLSSVASSPDIVFPFESRLVVKRSVSLLLTTCYVSCTLLPEYRQSLRFFSCHHCKLDTCLAWKRWFRCPCAPGTSRDTSGQGLPILGESRLSVGRDMSNRAGPCLCELLVLYKSYRWILHISSRQLSRSIAFRANVILQPAIIGNIYDTSNRAWKLPYTA